VDLHLTVVSPHRDDAALSAAATLDILCRRGATVTVVSCYTESAWAPFLPPSRTVEEITRVREAEDECYVQRLGGRARALGLDLLDAPLRRPGRGVFERSDEQETADAEALVVALRPHLSRDAVLFPLALGGHVDHRVARAAALGICRGVPLAFYEDVPYAFRCERPEVAAEVATLERQLECRLYPVRVLHPDGLAIWRRAARCYPSQFSREYVAKMLWVLVNRGGERLWATWRLCRILREAAAA
jgi:LmbE family N-acetylglucosaminyl deacetylase